MLFKSVGRAVQQHTIVTKRNFWAWLNIIFNQVDTERRKLLGPDRTCAEWILRNGGSIKFVGVKEFLSNYNNLPPEGAVFYVQEVDATEASITHHGFPHFVGCKFIEKIILHKCDYLEDQALEGLAPLHKSLKHLQISNCVNITEKGLGTLHPLINLKTLLLFNLIEVKNKDAVIVDLKNKLPQCDITFK